MTNPLELFSASKSGLELVEERMKVAFRSDAPLLSTISEYLLSLGGKRIRPILALTCGRLFGMTTPSQELVDAAAGIEIIHMATLLHDDIIDASPIRRHKPSAYAMYGMSPSLLAGDFLLARAFGMCAHLDLFVVEATERACVELTEGELLEGFLHPDEPKRMENYLTVVRKKTSSLFGLAAAVGAHTAGASAKAVEHLTEFGLLAGTAFQMVDDILDVTAEEDLLGKPSGTDLRQKTPSLVNILWLESGDPEADAFFRLPEVSMEQAKQVAQKLRESEIIAQSKKLARDYADRAKQELRAASGVDHAVEQQLVALVDYTIERFQ